MPPTPPNLFAKNTRILFSRRGLKHEQVSRSNMSDERRDTAPKHGPVRFAFQRCAILCLHKITLPQKRLPSETRHFTRKKLAISPLPNRGE
jgi:hypothetical protein